MLALALQGVFSLIASGVMLLLLQPTWYLLIGAITALISGVLILHARASVIDETADVEMADLEWVTMTLIIVLCIGLFWPIVPCATAYGALVDHAEHLQGRSRGH